MGNFVRQPEPAQVLEVGAELDWLRRRARYRQDPAGFLEVAWKRGFGFAVAVRRPRHPRIRVPDVPQAEWRLRRSARMDPESCESVEAVLGHQPRSEEHTSELQS